MTELPRRGNRLAVTAIALGIVLVLSQIPTFTPSQPIILAGLLIALCGACWLAD